MVSVSQALCNDAPFLFFHICEELLCEGGHYVLRYETASVFGLSPFV